MPAMRDLAEGKQISGQRLTSISPAPSCGSLVGLLTARTHAQWDEHDQPATTQTNHRWKALSNIPAKVTT
jgi:hypothetical protein